MFLALFSSVVLVGLVTVGSVSHVPREDSISCTPVQGATGKLQIANLPDAPVGLQMVNELQQVAGDPGQRFSFENCTSTYMNLPTVYAGLATVYYGRVFCIVAAVC
jgi:hypothetical protein